MPDNIKLKCDEIKPLARGQAVVEAVKPVDSGCRVLSVTATPCVVPGDVFPGEVRYTGKVKFDWVTVTDGKLDCQSAVAEFSDKISAPELAAGMSVSLMPEIVNCEAVADGGSIKAVAVVDSKLYGVVHGDHECLSAPDDGIYCEKKSLGYYSVVAAFSETAYVSDSVSEVKGEEALASVSRAVITDAACGDGEVRISGAAYTTVFVRTEDGLISRQRLVTPFVKSFTALGASEGCVAFAAVCVADSTATFTSSPDGNTVDIAVTLRIDGSVCDVASAEAVTDVFCVDSELEVTEETVALCAVEPLTTVVDSVDGQVPLDPDKPAADSVLCVCAPFCTVSDARVEGNRVNVEGLAGGDIVYYNAEKNAVDSLAFRIPFSMPIAVSTECENVDVSAEATNVTVRVRRESVFDVKVETAFTVRAAECRRERVITGVKFGAPIEKPCATVVVHIAKPGETLWQAAKALGCPPERVDAQNAARAPYAGGERLVNFCGK